MARFDKLSALAACICGDPGVLSLSKDAWVQHAWFA